MITQPNQGREIMITFKMVPSIARADATIFICFVDDVVLDRRVSLEYLEAW